MTSKQYYDLYMRKSSEEGICPVCGKETNWFSFDRGYLQHCSKKCADNSEIAKKKREKTNIEKYGVLNPFQADEIKEKIKNTCQEKYGVSYNLQRAEIIEQSKRTKEKKYGDSTYNNIAKAKQTCIAKYGVDSYVKTEQFKTNLIEKLDFYDIAKKTHITHSKNIKQMKQHGYIPAQEVVAKYGQSWYKNNIVSTIYKYHTMFISLEDEKIIEEYYNNTNGRSSQAEYILLDLIKKYYNGKIIHGDTKTITPFELDFLLPDLNIAIEYNGTYWHSIKFKGKDYHYNKSIQCYNKGIRLVHFYELEDWQYIENFIKNMINKTETVTNDFNKFSPIQLNTDKVAFSGPQLISENIYGSGTFSVLR